MRLTLANASPNMPYSSKSRGNLKNNRVFVSANALHFRNSLP